MPTLEAIGNNYGVRPYRHLKEDPKFDQIRSLIEKLPPDKLRVLEKYIQRWSNESARPGKIHRSI